MLEESDSAYYQSKNPYLSSAISFWVDSKDFKKVEINCEEVNESLHEGHSDGEVQQHQTI